MQDFSIKSSFLFYILKILKYPENPAKLGHMHYWGKYIFEGFEKSEISDMDFCDVDLMAILLNLQ